jgi:hypothetical protein
MLGRSEIIHYENACDVVKGIVGTLATTGGIIMSLLPEIEAILRVISLLVGIGVGIVTIRSILRRKQ